MTKLHHLAEIGQAIWIDYIRRSFIHSGEMGTLVEQGIRGMTSNPSIFEKAIAGSDDYDRSLGSYSDQGDTVQKIYERLAIEDICDAADILKPLYDQTGGADGYVSLEVNPNLARDTDGTIAEAHRLWETVARPNLMIKIPATKEGLPAIRKSISNGINVNVTLIFALERYRAVMNAFLEGIEERLSKGKPVDHIASVASFFVSRVDTKVDKRLQEIIRSESQDAELASQSLGSAAIANARLAYQLFEEVFGSGRFKQLQEQGARIQRPLWASTSTKNPSYSDIRYVQELIGSDTVNTLPQNTLEAFLDHGEVRISILDNLEEATITMKNLDQLGINMSQVTDELEFEGVDAFANSFNSLMQSIAEKRAYLSKQQIKYWWIFGDYSDATEKGIKTLQKNNIIERVWNQDHTVWSDNPSEISNRLGWLHIAEDMRTHIPKIEALVYAVQQAGYQQVLLLGMGGSSLAPELFGRTFGTPKNYLTLNVLDSTDPEVVQNYTHDLDFERTLFIVSTKSGGTVETLSFFKHFYHQVYLQLGEKAAGDHFVAITDPGSKLVEMAKEYRFRATFLNDPNIGGRYSALSYFGLVPAALTGVDIDRLLDSAIEMAKASAPSKNITNNPAAKLGATMGVLAGLGRDKLTLSISPEISSFGDWVEQLIAESTGKRGTGILPVVGEDIAIPEKYGNDRLFVEIQLRDGENESVAIDRLADAGHPLVRILIHDRYSIGGLFLLWELATAVSGYFLKINPFDQPNVESAKVIARQMVSKYQEVGELPEEEPSLRVEDITVYGSTEAQSPEEALEKFLNLAHPGDYVALQAFVTPDIPTSSSLQALRNQIRDHYQLATTVGFGPRFLHSTGQLHKGDGNNGLFIQFTSIDQVDVPIPLNATSDRSGITFGVLKQAQAIGDRQALLDSGRRVIRFHASTDIAELIQHLADKIESRISKG